MGLRIESKFGVGLAIVGLVAYFFAAAILILNSYAALMVPAFLVETVHVLVSSRRSSFAKLGLTALLLTANLVLFAVLAAAFYVGVSRLAATQQTNAVVIGVVLYTMLSLALYTAAQRYVGRA